MAILPVKLIPIARSSLPQILLLFMKIISSDSHLAWIDSNASLGRSHYSEIQGETSINAGVRVMYKRNTKRC